MVVAAGLLWPVAAISQDGSNYFVTGNLLYDQCTASSETTRALCLSYVGGATDAFDIDGTVCVPRGVTVPQVKDVIVNYLTAHPEHRHLPAAALIVTALGQAFPCQK
jgi:hypothetical protein